MTGSALIAGYNAEPTFFSALFSQIHAGDPGANGSEQLFDFHAWILLKKYSPDTGCHDDFFAPEYRFDL